MKLYAISGQQIQAEEAYLLFNKPNNPVEFIITDDQWGQYVINIYF